MIINRRYVVAIEDFKYELKNGSLSCKTIVVTTIKKYTIKTSIPHIAKAYNTVAKNKVKNNLYDLLQELLRNDDEF